MKLLTLLLLPALALSSQDGKPNTSGAAIPPLPEFDRADPGRYGLQIADYLDRFDEGWVDEVTRGVMTLYDADGDSVERTFSRMSLEKLNAGDKFITKFLSPAEIKGVAALTHENPGSSDDNWLYLPSNKRVRRISGANNQASFQGTEFTYEDLANIDPTEYEWRFVEETTLERDGEAEPVLELHAKPTYADTGYSRLVVYVHRELWRTERIEYFDKAGQRLKTRDSSNWRHIHGRFWREKSIDMTNHQTGKRTVLVQSKQFLNLSLYKSSKTGEARPNLSDDQFTTRAIQS